MAHIREEQQNPVAWDLLKSAEARIEKITLGAERKLVMSAEDRRRVAYHEAGHALIGLILPEADREDVRDDEVVEVDERRRHEAAHEHRPAQRHRRRLPQPARDEQQRRERARELRAFGGDRDQGRGRRESAPARFISAWRIHRGLEFVVVQWGRLRKAL